MLKLTYYQKTMLKSMVPALLFLTGYFTLLWLIPVKNWLIAGLLLVTMSFCVDLVRSIHEQKKIRFINWVRTFIVIAALVGISSWLGAYGAIGVAAVVLIIVVYKLVSGRRQYMKGMREIETQLFGKPLDKKEWGEDKPKFPKVKL